MNLTYKAELRDKRGHAEDIIAAWSIGAARVRDFIPWSFISPFVSDETKPNFTRIS